MIRDSLPEFLHSKDALRYEIILEWMGDGLLPDDLLLNFVPGSKEFPESLNKLIEVERKELIRKGGWDGRILSYKGHQRDGRRLVLDVGLTSYSAFLATNIRLGQELWGKDRQLLADGMVNTTLFLTSDEKILMGLRSGNSLVGADRVGLFGGMVSVDDGTKFEIGNMESGKFLFDSLARELHEELGLPIEVIDTNIDTVLFALARDPRYFRPNLFFTSKANLTAEEVVSYFRKGGNINEHVEIYVIEGNPGSINSFLREFYDILTESTKIGLRLYLRYLVNNFGK